MCIIITNVFEFNLFSLFVWTLNGDNAIDIPFIESFDINDNV